MNEPACERCGKPCLALDGGCWAGLCHDCFEADADKMLLDELESQGKEPAHGAKLYWGTVCAQTDVGGLWVDAKVRPWPYWFAKRLWLFASIVWRRVECSRLDCRTAWMVSEVAVGIGPTRIYRLGRRTYGKAST